MKVREQKKVLILTFFQKINKNTLKSKMKILKRIKIKISHKQMVYLNSPLDRITNQTQNTRIRKLNSVFLEWKSQIRSMKKLNIMILLKVYNMSLLNQIQNPLIQICFKPLNKINSNLIKNNNLMKFSSLSSQNSKQQHQLLPRRWPLNRINSLPSSSNNSSHRVLKKYNSRQPKANKRNQHKTYPTFHKAFIISIQTSLFHRDNITHYHKISRLNSSHN